MIEPPRSFGLAEESRSRLSKFRIAEFAGERNGLDRDQAIDGGISAQIDDAHRAAADFALELVAAEALRVLPSRTASGPAAAPAGDAPGLAAATAGAGRAAALAGAAAPCAGVPRAAGTAAGVAAFDLMRSASIRRLSRAATSR